MEPLISWDAGALNFLNQDFPQTVRGEFYLDNLELAQLINSRIQERTQRLTGALITSEKYEVNRDPSDDNLVFFYSDAQEQLDVWKRVYVAYQEGGALGLPTYTNPPREMYAKVETEDMELIQAWGYATLGNAVDKLASGRGITAPGLFGL